MVVDRTHSDYYFVDNSLFIFEDGPWAICYFLLLQFAIGKVPGTCFFLICSTKLLDTWPNLSRSRMRAVFGIRWGV